MRIYLSGPITGQNGYKRVFSTAQELLQEKGHKDVVNPAELDKVLPEIEKMDHEEIVLLCFDLLNTCDAMVMLPGWKKSTGCMAEWGYAHGQGNIIIAEFEDFLAKKEG